MHAVSVVESVAEFLSGEVGVVEVGGINSEEASGEAGTLERLGLGLGESLEFRGKFGVAGLLNTGEVFLPGFLDCLAMVGDSEGEVGGDGADDVGSDKPADLEVFKAGGGRLGH